VPVDPAPRKFNLTAEEAIPELEAQLAKMRGETDRAQLADIDSDTAYELGYESCLFDLRHFTGPDPREVGVAIITPNDDGTSVREEIPSV
jgi:hypothetical protein